jgi:hypothetical protein
MIEYTYFELFLMGAFFVTLGYALKYREEAIATKRFIKAILADKILYDKIKSEHDTFMKELRNAD